MPKGPSGSSKRGNAMSKEKQPETAKKGGEARQGGGREGSKSGGSR